MSTLITINHNQIEVTNKKCAGAISRIAKALDGMKRNTIEVSKAVYEVVESECFKDDFETKKKFAKAIGFSESAISRMHRAYKLVIEHKEEVPCLELMSEGQLEELLPLVKYDGVVECIHEKGISDSDNRDIIRSKVDDFINSNEEVEEVEEVEETEENKNCACEIQENVVYFDNVAYELTEEQIAKVHEFINKLITA